MLERLKQQVSPYRQARCWYIAYSGGLDSHVLLHSLATLKQQDSTLPPLVAVHVNHQLQPAAGAWEAHCRQQAASLAVEFSSATVTVAENGSTETAARAARYQVFSGLLQEGGVIFLAHHQQDQVETFLYRLFRGAGTRGLASIRRERPLANGALVRPMLDFTREALADYARQNRLDYIHDPSNDDTAFDRNYIRHQLLPVMRQRWPAALATMHRAIDHLQESAALLDELAQNDLANLKTGEADESWLVLQQLAGLSEARQKNLLRFWLARHDIQLSAGQLAELMHHVIAASEDGNPELVAGVKTIRRFRGRLYITPNGLPEGFAEVVWDGATTCTIAGYGTLVLSRPVDILLTVKPRQGGESIKPKGSKQTRKLKTLLQELQVPPWHRLNLPLIYHGEELIAVGNLVVTECAAHYLQGSEIILV